MKLFVLWLALSPTDGDIAAARAIATFDSRAGCQAAAEAIREAWSGEWAFCLEPGELPMENFLDR